MTTQEKTAYIKSQIAILEFEVWKMDSSAKACVKAGLKERAEAIAKQSAENSLLIDAFNEQLAELSAK